MARSVLGAFRTLSGAQREDLAADVMQRLLEAVREGRIAAASDGEVAGYIRQALRNAARDLLERLRVRGETDEPSGGLPGPGADPERMAIALQGLARIRAAMDAWPLVDRLLFLMKLEGAPAADVRAALASGLGVHIDGRTVDTRFFRLRRKLAALAGGRT
jgi:DNA-directed RNA polymerase specialized sigma24 family protein